MSDSDGGPPPPNPPSPDAYLRGGRGEPPGGLRWGEASSAARGARRPWRRQRPPSSGRPEPDWPWQVERPEGKAATALGQGFQRNTVFVGFAWALAAFLLLPLVAFGVLLAVVSDPSDEAETLVALIVTLVVDAVAFVLIPVWVLGGRRPALAALGVRRPSLLAVGWGLAGLGMAYVVLGIYAGVVDLINVDALEPVSTIDDDVIYDHIPLVVLTGILTVIVAPLAEELFYRGFLVRGIARRWSILPAVLVSSALFAAVHLDVGSLIPFALIGAVFAFVYLRSGNLFSSVIAHFLFNAIAFSAIVADQGVG